jgi:nitrate/TMAO reductase-like tetraheme cytochrome c subunit
MEPQEDPAIEPDAPEWDDSPVKVPSLLHNYISLGGMSVVLASLTSIILLMLIELTNVDTAPYMGLLTYILLPAGLTFGIAIILLGMIIEKWRRRKLSPEEIAAYPILDLSGPRRRRRFLTFIFFTVLFLFITAFGSYEMFEYTESVAFCGQRCHEVMKPEYTAYLAGSHARVRCVDCHVGAGADWYVKSKLSGAYQLYSVTFNKFSRPITTPVHNLRPAQETCEQCHWPEKFFGAQMKVFNRYGTDQMNTLHQLRMLINVGGGSPQNGQVAGIHWHMNIANEVTYIATDEHRQQIPWVRIKDMYGNVTEYFDKTKPLSDSDVATMDKRKMDCMDCHNRPAHVYQPPDVAMDQQFSAGKADPSLPFLKREAIALLSGNYDNNDQALANIYNGLMDFYRTNYPDVFAQKQDAIKSSIEAVQTVYQTYFFPEMKTNWQTHPNNIGHMTFPGCFRCHDGNHVSKSGKVITNDCNVCHTVIYDSQAPPERNAKLGGFVHPVDLGGLETRSCNTCHKPDKPFQHPINLGDISQFQCVTCHPRPVNNLVTVVK